MNWLINFFSGCTHAKVTRPLTPRGRPTYVCCLECGAEFPYPWNAMRQGPAIRLSPDRTALEVAGERG